MIGKVGESVKDRLRELRIKKKLTQDEFAKILGIARTTYSGYENGSREPDYNTLVKIADYFGVSTDYLLGRDMKDYIDFNNDEIFKKDFVYKGKKLSDRHKRMIVNVLREVLEIESQEDSE